MLEEEHTSWDRVQSKMGEVKRYWRNGVSEWSREEWIDLVVDFVLKKAAHVKSRGVVSRLLDALRMALKILITK